MEFNARDKELTLKVVYYGPALSGKTTNLQALHRCLDPNTRGPLTSLDTEGDRTLFFDLLPVNFRASSGVLVKLKLFTVPGQVIHDATRRLVLRGTDGIVFVADSRRAATIDNNESFRSLDRNLRAHGKSPNSMPTVIQFNKRDLEEIRSDAELEQIAKQGKEPVFGAIAIQGLGVLETLRALMLMVYVDLDSRHDFGRKYGLPRDEFMDSIFGTLSRGSDQKAAS